MQTPGEQRQHRNALARWGIRNQDLLAVKQQWNHQVVQILVDGGAKLFLVRGAIYLSTNIQYE